VRDAVERVEPVGRELLDHAFYYVR
jgi:hypothetical protein